MAKDKVDNRQTHKQTDTQTDGKTDAGQSDPYVPLCFAGDTKISHKFGQRWYP